MLGEYLNGGLMGGLKELGEGERMGKMGEYREEMGEGLGEVGMSLW